MIRRDGYSCFGFFKGLPYGNCIESFDDYSRTDCILSRDIVNHHFDSLNAAYTSAPTSDLFTGEPFLGGLYDDGDFLFTIDFVRYFKQGKVDIPKEYEDYMINELQIS
ncbi:MAG: hypothetical protein IKF22_05020 [Lachnospiraceae bacterium]|nr:hypothetical protein [Lachnospiraceae bacterium]